VTNHANIKKADSFTIYQKRKRPLQKETQAHQELIVSGTSVENDAGIKSRVAAIVEKHEAMRLFVRPLCSG